MHRHLPPLGRALFLSLVLTACAAAPEPTDHPATISADRPFRLRFAVVGATGQALKLQYQHNQGLWTDAEAHDFPYPDEATPRVSTVSTPAYEHGAATARLLPRASGASFRGGFGVSLAEAAPPLPGGDGQAELEWALVARRFADGPVTSEEGDVFQFRMTTLDGQPIGGRTPELTFSIPPGHVGGTFVETPGRIGPWQASNGDLYFIMEPTETDNVFMMVKSSDGGVTWREVDGTNRPRTDDLEAVDSRLVGHTIHMVHQITRSVVYHAFRTSDHPTQPDSWAVTDEPVASVTAVAQAATLVARPDGSLVAFYVGQTRIHHNTRSGDGRWGDDAVLDTDVVHPQAVGDAEGVIHVAYCGSDGTIWYRRMLRDGSFTNRERIAVGAETGRPGFGSVLPLVYLPDSDTVVIVYRLASGELWERRVPRRGSTSVPARVTDVPVIQHAVDSQQTGADVVADGAAPHVLFIDRASQSIFSTHDRGGWQAPRPEVGDITGSWVRGNVVTRPDGVRVYGFIYDAGSKGGAGMNRYAEIVLPPR